MSRKLGALLLAVALAWPSVAWGDVLVWPSRSTLGFTLKPAADNTYDLGTSALRWRTGYFGTAVVIGTNPATSGALRLASSDIIYWRNAANTANLQGLYINGNNQGIFGEGTVHFSPGAATQDLGDWSNTNVWRSGYFRTSLYVGNATPAASTVEINKWVVKASGVEINVASGVTLNNVVSVPGVGLGTLTNAPSAGNPTTWLPVTINGVVGKIPVW